MKTLAKIAAAAVTLTVLMTGLAVEAQAEPKPATYNVIVRTGTRSGAGTDSNIFITIYGSTGKTREVRLNGYIRGDAFENGQKDRLSFSGLDVGEVRSIVVRSDNSYLGSAWDLSYINVQKTGHAAKQARFNRWIETGMLSATAPLK